MAQSSPRRRRQCQQRRGRGLWGVLPREGRGTGADGNSGEAGGKQSVWRPRTRRHVRRLFGRLYGHRVARSGSLFPFLLGYVVFLGFSRSSYVVRVAIRLALLSVKANSNTRNHLRSCALISLKISYDERVHWCHLLGSCGTLGISVHFLFFACHSFFFFGSRNF